MPSTVLAMALVFLLCAVPASAADFDGDGVEDALDNCSEVPNPYQVDTDSDDCGNVCDADYDNSGVAGHPDWFEFILAFGTVDPEKCHFEPISAGCIPGLSDFNFWIANGFESVPGPSGTTAGTTACP